MLINVTKVVILFYVGLFLSLSVWVIAESINTRLWAHTDQYSVVFALSVSSGWFDKVAAPLNALFGASGGILAAYDEKSGKANGVFTVASAALCGVTALTTLVGMMLVSLCANDIADHQNGLHGLGTPAVKDAVTALGLMNLSILAGFVVGVGAQKTVLTSKGG